jgi:hypothetical protein
MEAVASMLVLPDEELRVTFAECPLQEPPRFSATLRATLEFIAKNSDSRKVFGDGPIRFTRSPIGAWVLVPKK